MNKISKANLCICASDKSFKREFYKVLLHEPGKKRIWKLIFICRNKWVLEISESHESISNGQSGNPSVDMIAQHLYTSDRIFNSNN